MAGENGVFIPIIIDVEGAFEDAAQRVDKAIEPLMAKMSKHALNLKFNIDENSKRSVKTLLTDSALSAEQLEKALASIRDRIMEMKAKGGFNMAEGLKEDERELIQVFSIVAQKYRGTGLLLKSLMDDAERFAKVNAESAREVTEYWSKIDSIINSTGNSITELSMKLKAGMEKLQITPAKLDDGSSNPAYDELLTKIKEWQKALYQYRLTLKDAVSGERERIEVLEEEEQSMRILNMQMSEWRKILENAPVGGEEFAEAARNIQALANEIADANYQFKMLSTNEGSIKRVSAEIAELNRKWAEASQDRKFNADGSLTGWAEGQVMQMKNLTEYSEKYGMSLEQIIAKRKELKAHEDALHNIGTSMSTLNQNLAAWRKELDSAQIDSPQWETAARMVALLSQKIKEAGDRVQELGLKSGSIEALNAKVQSLVNQWNQLSNRFGADGRMTSEARAIYNEFVKANKELQKEGQNMAAILQKQEALTQKLREQDRVRRRNQLVLSSEANTIDRIREKIQLLTERLGRVKIGSGQFTKISAEIDVLNQKLQEAQGKTRRLGDEMDRNHSLLSNLIKKSLYLFGLHTVTRFIQNIRQVTAEFELQRVALGAIIQDAERANSLFKQIKAAAIKSPFEIKDLVSYTKQLSAYQIETDKLYDTTMKLADVSAGLGVDMGRLILAYGQVRAASVLRGQELRQFTEAGIPLVEKLAEKFSELNNRTVTTAEVFELISKRAVSFEMVADVFNDMTEAGGMFYKMQEKQAETLAGQWSNLKDSVSIMYDEMGNTGPVHDAMTSLISVARSMMQNWRTIGNVIKWVGIQFATMKLATLFIPNLTKSTKLAEKASLAKARADKLAAKAAREHNTVMRLSANSLKIYAKWMRKAATATTVFGRSFKQAMAGFLSGGWISAAITALTILVSWIASAAAESRRLGKELSENVSKGEIEIDRSIRNFEYLAKKATEAADGSADQRDALAELKRTYGDIIPSQELEIEKLRALKGNYDSLTDAIRDNIEMRIHEENLDTISDNYSEKIAKQRKGIEDYLKNDAGFSVGETAKIMKGINDAIKDGLITTESDFFETAKVIDKIIEDTTGRIGSWGQAVQQVSGFWATNSYFNRWVKDSEKFNQELDNENERFEALENTMGDFKDAYERLQEQVKKNPSGFKPSEAFGFEFNEAKWKQTVQTYRKAITGAFLDYGLGDVLSKSGAFDIADSIDFVKILDSITADMPNGLKQFIEKIQKDYLGIAPQEDTTRMVTQKAKEFADKVGVSMNAISGYLKRDGDDLTKYTKTLGEDIEKQKHYIQELQTLQASWTQESNFPRPTDEQIANENKELQWMEMMLQFLSAFKKETHTGYTQDPFIKQMQDRMKFMQDFKKGYDNLSKYINKSGALGQEAGNMLNRGLSLGIDPAQQKRAAEDLSKWYQDAMDEVFKQAQKKGAGNDMTAFLSKQITGNSNKAKALRDFQQLLQSLWDAKTDFDTTQMTKNFDNAFKKMKDELKQSETVKKFYDDVLSMTGNSELATTLTVSVYGNVGQDFKERMQSQLNEAFASLGDDAKTPEMKAAIDSQDFGYILDNLSQFSKEWQDVLKDMAKDSQKYSADIMKNFADLVAKYGSTAQKIATIEAKAENEVKKVEDALAKSLTDLSLTPEQKKALQDRATEIIKAINAEKDIDVFKQSDEYIKFFSEINVMTAEQAATVRGELRKAYLKAFREGAISADELRKNLRAIDEQFRKLSESSTMFGAYLSGGIDAANKKMQEYADNVTVLAAKMKSGKGLDSQEQNFASKMLQMFGSESTEGIKNYEQLIAAFSNSGGIEAAGEAFGQMGEGMSAMAANGPGALAIVDAIFKAVHATISGIQQIIDQLNEVRSEENKIGDWFKYISDFDRYTFSGWEKLKSGDAIGATVDAISSWISIFTNAQKDKVKKFNDQIKEQGTLLEDLEYEHSRLSVAIEKSFGSDYISNYNKQLDVLRAQAEAYRKQAELERKKGKSADEDTAKGYEKSARDVEDQIADMQSRLSEFFTGTDVTSAAKDFAKAWIEAYKQFGNTTGAMKEKFSEMIENMVVNSLAAQLIQGILKPVFDQIDEAAKGGELTAQEIGAISAMLPERMRMIDDSMLTMMNQLTSAGINLREQAGQFTGISRDIAGASEESITGLAAGINTQNFYMSYMPAISATVDAILAAIGGSTGENTAAGRAMARTAAADSQTGQTFGDETFRGQMRRIDENISEMRYMLKSVITPKSANTNTHAVAIK